jgi:hypothetical protein
MCVGLMMPQSVHSTTPLDDRSSPFLALAFFVSWRMHCLHLVVYLPQSVRHVNVGSLAVQALFAHFSGIK